MLRPLLLFPTVWKAPYTSVIFSDSPLRLPTCHPPSFFFADRSTGKVFQPSKGLKPNCQLLVISMPCRWMGVCFTYEIHGRSGTRKMETTQARENDIRKGRGVFPFTKCERTCTMRRFSYICLVASERRMPIVRIVENILQFKKNQIPSRELTYPTWGKGKSSSKCHFWGIC